MIRIRWTGVIVLALGVAPGLLWSAERPNIIVVFADDMGYGDVGCYNPQSRIPTPHMDHLAKEGIRFTDAHSGNSMCTPSRYVLMTGRHCWRTPLTDGVLFNYEPPLIEQGRMTMASLLRQAGYVTGMVGKWHLGLNFTVKKGKSVDFDRPLPWPGGPDPDPSVGASIDFSAPVSGGPNDLGFDYAFYTAGCSTDQEPFCFIEDRKFLGMRNATYRRPAGSWRAGTAAPDWVNETVDVTFTDVAVRFIERSRRKAPEKPFFLYLPLSAPHSPHMVPDFASGKSEAGVRGDMVWLVDWSVGRIAKTLEELGIADDTLLMVTSDNGPLKGSQAGVGEGSAEITNGHKSAGELNRYKSSIFEGGHRVPFIARWPRRIAAGVSSDELLSQVDLLATCAAIVGAQVPASAGEDSVNRLSALLGEATSPRPPLVHHTGGPRFAVRKGQWKLLYSRVRGGRKTAGFQWQLYDLAADLGETTDLADQHPEVVEELRGILEKYQREGRSVPPETGVGG